MHRANNVHTSIAETSKKNEVKSVVFYFKLLKISNLENKSK